MNILDTIIAHKRTEVEKRRISITTEDLERSPYFMRSPCSLKESLLDESRTGIIAEFKRQSPSKGVINGNADVTAVTTAYADNGASGLSVLTDEQFFGGCTADLMMARVNKIPILRKDFIIDEYQIVEARAMGADVILLIAACLSPAAVKRLALFAKSLNLEVLLELHTGEELGHICDETELVGVNNRNLKTFEVDIERSLEMARQIPENKIKIAESGISSVGMIRLFRENGFKGFLVGETFMKEKDPGAAFKAFADNLFTSFEP